jgi:myo-inositol catabolism protein IolC
MTGANSHRIYLLAFDHRGSFQSTLLGIPGDPAPADVARITEAKGIIFKGFRRALDGDLGTDGAGILVDEQFGAEIARAARELGVALAMPVEKSGQDEFDFEYGDRFGDHIAAFDPTYAKVLVRYNAEGDVELNKRQAERLARLGEWLQSHGRRFLFELLVPPESHQLERVGNDPDRYDRELRPDLMIAAIRELQAAGVEPDVWKIEGLDARDDCARLSEVARAGGRDAVECVVLGRGGDESKVEQWLQTGAGVPGFVGFAVGRTIWWNPLEEWLAGGSEDDAADKIAGNYRRLVEAYTSSEKALA